MSEWTHPNYRAPHTKELDELQHLHDSYEDLYGAQPSPELTWDQYKAIYSGKHPGQTTDAMRTLPVLGKMGLGGAVGGALGYGANKLLRLGSSALVPIGATTGGLMGGILGYSTEAKRQVAKDLERLKEIGNAKQAAYAKYAGLKIAAPWSQMAGQAIRNLGPAASGGAKNFMGAAKAWGGQVANKARAANDVAGRVAGREGGNLLQGALAGAKTFGRSRVGQQALGAGALGAGAMYGGYKMMQPSKPPQQG